MGTPSAGRTSDSPAAFGVPESFGGPAPAPGGTKRTADPGAYSEGASNMPE
jgi:hypothetical protein